MEGLEQEEGQHHGGDSEDKSYVFAGHGEMKNEE